VCALELAEAQYMRATHRNVRRIAFDYEPIAAIASLCGRMFSGLDREDQEQSRIARVVWRAKSTVLQTLLPFDDTRLGLAAHIQEIRKAAGVLPALTSVASSLVDTLETLLAHPLNPKREWLVELVAPTRSAEQETAILAALQGAGTPGWPNDITVGVDLGSELITLIRTRKDLRYHVFDRAIISGTTRFAGRPLVTDLLYGGRALEVFVLAYKHERPYLPDPLTLPTDHVFQPQSSRPIHVHVQAEDEPDTELDRWVNHSIWEEIRSRHDLAPVSDRDVTVGARFVLFADESGAFLPDDRRVVEISELFDSADGLNAIEEQLPRKAVRDLEEGDLVLLRLAGGGHYVEDVADGLMAKAGVGSLRNDATEWKERLHRVLKQHGEGFVAKTARDLGLRLRAASYLWVWASDAVMAPQDLNTFNALMRAVIRLDSSEPVLDAQSYAQEKWQKMEQVKTFHIRAGTIIRNVLLERVRELVMKRQKIDTSVSIALPGVEAGRMGLLRVSAVDTKPMQVPLSQLFHIRPARGK
jgi:hypothetical protein